MTNIFIRANNSQRVYAKGAIDKGSQVQKTQKIIGNSKKKVTIDQTTLEFPFDSGDPSLVNKAIFSSPQSSLQRLKATQDGIQQKLNKFEENFAQKFQELIVQRSKKKSIEQSMPTIRVSSKDPQLQQLRKVFSIIKTQNQRESSNDITEKQSQANLQKIDVQEYLDALKINKKEKDKEVIEEHKELQIKLQKQLNQFKNLKDVNDKLFYTPSINSTKAKSPGKNFDILNESVRHANDYSSNSMAYLGSMNSTVIISDNRIQPLNNEIGYTRNMNKSPDRPNPERHQLLLRRYNIRKAEEQSQILSGSSLISSNLTPMVADQNKKYFQNNITNSRYNDNQSMNSIFTQRRSSDNPKQTLKCLNEEYKLSYNKDAFMRFYKLKQSLQSQNILFNQLKEQQKLTNRGQESSQVENNPDFFITVRNHFHQQNIRHISVGFAISAINDHIYLLGGKISSFTKKGISKALYDSGLQNLKFEEIQDHQQDSSPLINDIFNRYGHHMHTFDEQLVIVGGESGAINNTSVRAVISDIAFLNITTMRRQIITFYKPLPKLRAFASCILGKYLYQFGGILESGDACQYLTRIRLNQDRYELFKWKEVDLQINTRNLSKVPKRSYATIQAVYYEQKLNKYRGRNQDFNLGSLTQDIDWKLAQSYIEVEGLYIFGGLDEKTQPTNELFVIKIDEHKNHRISQIQTFGKRPQERFMHSMNLFKQSNVLIITGGRNDNLPQNNILGDMHILYLDSLNWIEVTFCNHRILPRFQFQSTIIDTKLIIIGGMNASYKIMHDYEVIELDQEANFQNHASKYLFKKMGSFLRANLAKKKSMEMANSLQTSLDLNNELIQSSKEITQNVKQLRSKEEILQDLLKLNLSKVYKNPGYVPDYPLSSQSKKRDLNKSSINLQQDYGDQSLNANVPDDKKFIFRGKRRSLN